jgi:hypothetical protein
MSAMDAESLVRGFLAEQVLTEEELAKVGR